MTTTELAELHEAIQENEWGQYLPALVRAALSDVAARVVDCSDEVTFLIERHGWAPGDIRQALTDAADEARAEQEQS